MNHRYSLDICENESTTSIVVNSDRHSIQITTAQKDDHAMVFVWAEVAKLVGEHRCDTMELARTKAWELARQSGEQMGRRAS